MRVKRAKKGAGNRTKNYINTKNGLWIIKIKIILFLPAFICAGVYANNTIFIVCQVKF